MRHALALLAAGCGAPVYFPEEPPPVGSFQDTALDPGDTGPVGEPAELPCSGYASTPVNLRVINSGATNLDLWWRDYQCAEVFYGTVPPGGTFDQATSSEHAWVLRELTGAYVDHRVLGNEPTVTWEVP